MFEDSLVESAALLRTHNRWPALLSISAQCAIAVLIVSVPLLHPDLISLRSRIPVSIAPPHIPPPHPVQPPPIRQVSRAAYASTSPVPVERTSSSHSLTLSGPPVDAPTLGDINLAPSAADLPLAITNAAPASPRVAVARSVGGPKSAPTHISSGVTAGHLVAPIRPDYPEIAKITRTQGTVVVDAIISRTGTIESAHVLSGPPMLQASALAAVRQARYRPFLLNGQPTEVQTTVTIVFRMSS